MVTTEQETKLGAAPGEGRKSTSALVVGGGVAGMQAALDIASQGFKVHLLEKIGKNIRKLLV